VQKAEIFTKRYVVCPACNDRDSGFGVDHLPRGTAWGPWFCDGCGRASRGRLLANGDVEIELVDECRISTMDLLVLEPQTSPVYFLVPGSRYEGRCWQSEGTTDDHKRFSYEEHSCPTNWLEPEAIRWEGDNDPHGLIKYVAHRDSTELPPESQPGNRQSWEYFSAFKLELMARGERFEDEE
jgi:hypothetical protein